MENKKAELEIALSGWWFFVIFIIAGGIVIAVSIYYSTDLDIKWLEADILAEKILDCSTDNGYLKDDFFNEENFYNSCNLNKNKFVQGSDYFFKIWADDEMVFGGGDYSIEKNCEIRKNFIITSKYFPICSEKFLSVLDKNGNKKTLKILAGSNQQGVVEANF